MTPVSPVVQGLEQFEIVFGADQPEYLPLPTLVGTAPNIAVISRWHLTDEERAQIAAGADIFTHHMTFGDMFQPLAVFVGTEKMTTVEAETFRTAYGIGEILGEKNIADMLDTLL